MPALVFASITTFSQAVLNTRLKILFISQYFPPEGAAPAARIGETAVAWVREGHEVRVLTGFPNYPNGIVPESYRKKLWRIVVREKMEGVRVTRTWLWARPNSGKWNRAVYYLSFFVSSLITGMFLGRPDVVVATSPPPFVALSGFLLARAKRVPFVFEVRDLWPESLTVLQPGAGQSALHSAVNAIVRLLYRKSEHIVVVSPAFKPHLQAEWGVAAERITVVENGILPDFFTPEGAGWELRKQLNLDQKFVASYIGTIGVAHGLEAILNAAEILKDHDDIVFMLVGDGAERADLEEIAKRRGLNNVRFLGLQPRQMVPALLRASDVALVLLKKSGVFKTVIPSKMLETMGCGRPCIVGIQGQGEEILQRAQAGIAIEPENARELAEAVLNLASDPSVAAEYGRNGRRHVLQFYCRDTLAQKYAATLAAVARAGSRGAM
jgi:glycosyltransferase involved in cell wall biosynthesis